MNSYGAHALVTGAGSGIGRAFAVELANRGSAVVCADVDEAGARETVALVEEAGSTGIATRCDVAREDRMWELSETAQRWLGRPPDLVVNNAGLGSGGAVIGETPLTDWRHTIGVNLWGVVHGCHVFVPWLRETGGGVINIASAAAFATAPRMGAYNASKAAVLALSETLAAELSGSGVTVSVVCPTFVKTGIVTGGRIEDSAAKLADRLMRITGATPERIAATALDAHDAGRLHIVPQFDARLLRLGKRFFPTTHTRLAGLLGRLLP